MLHKANLLTCSSHVPWLSSRAQNFCKLCQEGPLPASFHPRATQGQITSYCETRRVLLLPANTSRSSYIIFIIIIVVLDPEDKGLITFQTRLANGQFCWIKGATTVWDDDRMRIVHRLWERLVECLKICAGTADIGREERASSQSPQTAHQTAL